ncbi:RNA polymerase sigma factor SigX [Pirellula sp. SH-Sr6A]|uniref:RNA polymerase sigma factor n=1 Tax=Pirellula sp. SH-Sr6A TaxID=1632865 RepID=UPI00078B57F8|nr:sigma-70 family RNA polymerase sigma factor [Pirellula sp. SH-Sr6A]AMV34537.1 RNA polymerase sigma factor SigX [Pirellula sp. SH-Sr6A]
MSWNAEREIRSFVEQHGSALVLYARQFCSNPDDALQEALIDLARRMELPDNLLGWMYRVVKNKAMNQARADRRRANHQAVVALAGDSWFEEDPGVSLDAQCVSEWIGELGPLEREIVTAKIWGDLTFEQIAELTDTSTSTAYRYFVKSMERFRERFHSPSGDLR